MGWVETSVCGCPFPGPSWGGQRARGSRAAPRSSVLEEGRIRARGALHSALPTGLWSSGRRCSSNKTENCVQLVAQKLLMTGKKKKKSRGNSGVLSAGGVRGETILNTKRHSTLTVSCKKNIFRLLQIAQSSMPTVTISQKSNRVFLCSFSS